MAAPQDIRKTITCPVMSRPDLFDQMLGSLAACDLSGWHLFVGVEPGPHQDAFEPICRRHLAQGSYTLRVHPRKLGVRGNGHHLIGQAFAGGSRLNLCLEEDFLVAPDVLNLADWYGDNHQPHWTALNLLAGACGNPGYLSHIAHPDLLWETRCFNSYGVVLTADDWPRIQDVWLGPDLRTVRRYNHQALAKRGIRHLTREGWDWAVYGKVISTPEMRVVQPVAARCTHTGAEGLYCSPDYQEQAYGHLSLSECPAGQANYRVVDRRELPDLARGHAEALDHGAELLRLMHRPSLRRKWPPFNWIGALQTRIMGPVKR